MADKNGEEIPQVRSTKSRLHDSALSLVVIDVGHSESRPEEHLEQVSSVLLEGRTNASSHRRVASPWDPKS
jgi:hypothetical protein